MPLTHIKTQLKGQLEVREKVLVIAIREDIVRNEVQWEKCATGVKERLFWEGIKGRAIGVQGEDP